MRLKIISVIIMLVVSLSLLSCIVTSREMEVDISCDDFNQSPNSMRNEFEAEVGDKIRVKLCSNPSTGFQWKYEVIGNIVLKEEDYDFEEADDEELVGAAGKEVWTFEAIEKGTTEVRMEYTRSWEGGEQAEWTYTMFVTVE